MPGVVTPAGRSRAGCFRHLRVGRVQKQVKCPLDDSALVGGEPLEDASLVLTAGHQDVLDKLAAG